jgi:hypothetical protein
MIRNVLTHMDGIEVYGLISILLFFFFFAGTLVWAFRLNRHHLDAMGRIPLDETSVEVMHSEFPQTDERTDERSE